MTTPRVRGPPRPQMVVMLLQQPVPSLVAHPPCPAPGQALGPALGPAGLLLHHSPLVGSGSYEKVQLDASSGDAVRPPIPAPAPEQAPPRPPVSLHYDNRAMQYYRLWIYTCNGLLLVCVLGFAVVACNTVVFDQRRNLVPGLSLLQPTFLYGYLAVLSQSGFIQMIGCLGARRLNQKLLNVYWLLLLLLLFGDAMVGVVWLFRFESICEELRPWLRQRLNLEYGVDQYFTHTWDAYQRDNRCCGVQGPADYTVLNRSIGWLPDSCCRPLAALHQSPPRTAALRNFHYHGTTTSTPSTTTVGMELEDEYHIHAALPDSEGRPLPDLADLYCSGDPGLQDILSGATGATGAPGSSSIGSGGGSAGSSSGSIGGSSAGSSAGNIGGSSAGSIGGSSVGSSAGNIGGSSSGSIGGSSAGSSIPSGGGRIITHPVRTTQSPLRYYRTGCEDRLIAWLRSAADLLFIVGYCILGFVKVCFLGILRYEIKEMIQKIRLLQGELSAPQLNSPDQGGETGPAGPAGRKSPPPQAARFSNNNGSLVTGRGLQDDSPVIGSSRTPQERRGRADSGTTPLLLQPADSLQSTPLHQNPAHIAAAGGGGGAGGGVPACAADVAGSSGGGVLLQHTPLLHHRHHHHLSLHDGNDSDTNSHCALLISDEVGGSALAGGGMAGGSGGGGGGGKMSRQGSNGNNNYELHELHDINRILARHRTDI